ncbi:hypothetical protein BGX27_007989 [Mortierella sp. AM989]|nr:hypothetical protein BGX27_007989 [Mortierella sp. AM989]
MADRPPASETTTRRTTSRPAATRTATGTATRNTTTTAKPRATRTSTRSNTAVATAIASATPSSTAAPQTEGSSGALIGGIVAGLAVVLALVGLLLFKRRKRASVAAAATTKGGKGNMEAPQPVNATISGPMSLAPEDGIDAAPAHRPEAQFREQQQFRPGMRDELFAQPGSAIHKNLNKDKDNSKPPGAGNQGYANNHMNEKDIYSGNRPNQASPSDSYEDTLVSDYYGETDYTKETNTIGAQRSAPHPKDVSYGNLTPAPEYYMGKEDIDPRRDLRGLDSPEAY